MRAQLDSRRRRSFALVATVALAVGASVAVVSAPALPVSVAQASSGLGAGGEFFPLSPARIYDSRPGQQVNEPAPGARAATPAAPTFDIPLLGQGGVPTDASRVLAVVVNFTVITPTGSGWLNAFATGSPPATPTSIVNFTRNQIVPNLAIVRPGVDGKLTLQLFSSQVNGSAHVAVDVFGWIATSSNPERGARLVPVSPGRVLDTRELSSRVGPGQTVEVPIRGVTLNDGAGNLTPIPATSDVVGVVLNATGVNTLAGSADNFVSVLPETPTGPVTTSNLNLTRGQIKPNLVIVPLGADGKVRLYNSAGTTDLLVDVVGYLQQRPDDTRAGRVVPLAAPFRVFDTRDAAFGSLRLGPGQAEPWSFADFAGSVNIGGVPVGNQMAVIGNLTAADPSRTVATRAPSGFLSVFPDQLAAGAAPRSSNLNMAGDAAVPNLAVVKYGTSSIAWVYNSADFWHYLFDASAVVLAD